jgi:class 3 adenylate cyclase/tRNA A-37 threonylcarbamoyl transferase component Bud32
MSEATTTFWKGRYEIERPLGRGGMSAVYLAKDHQLLSKRVVIKVLLEEMDQDAWMRQKFFQEMEALARIDHPGVVGVLDTGQTPEGKQFLVMQYIEGQTLRSAITPGGMPVAKAANLIRQIGQALGAAHDAGVWHRDLKPENVMLQQSGGEFYAKLIDFGIAGIQNSQFTGEKTKVAGSLTYMAPEQFAGSPCAASDIYALGVVAYEMLTGEPPFSSSSMAHLVAEAQTIALPREKRPELSDDAGKAILKALSFRPEARQATVREFTEELYNALCGGPVSEPTRRTVAPAVGGLEMAHVLFTDLVGYSLLPMDKQKQYLGELQAVVRAAPRYQSAQKSGEVLSLPTGDGMALVFFGDPTAPAQCALEVAAGLKSKPHLQLRMGIHTGPVYRVADVNANANVAGGGINIAQRVMDCGDAGHILVSKAVADVLGQLSDWAPCLCDLGEHPVKHGVTVHIYNLATVDAGNPATPAKLAKSQPVPKRSKAPLAAIVAGVLVVVAAGGWFLARPKDTAGPAVPAAAVVEPLMLSYRVEGTPPTKVAFDVETPKTGFLYVLSYGNDGKQWTINLLHPLNSGNAERRAGQVLRLPEKNFYESDGKGPQDVPYLVWSLNPVHEIEELKKLPQQNGVAVVEDPKRVEGILKFLNEHRAQQVAPKGDETEVRSNDEVLVEKIPLVGK